MAKQIIVTDKAFADIEMIGDYYFDISEALKNRFEKELFDTIEHMAALPVSYKVYKLLYRCFTLPVFPYRIFYKEDEGSILIAAIIHTSRSDTFIKRRIR